MTASIKSSGRKDGRPDRESRKYFVHSVRGFLPMGDNHVDPDSELARQIRKANRDRIAREAQEMEELYRQKPLVKKDQKQQAEKGKEKKGPERQQKSDVVNRLPQISESQEAASDGADLDHAAEVSDDVQSWDYHWHIEDDDYVYEGSRDGQESSLFSFSSQHSDSSDGEDLYLMSGAIRSPQGPSGTDPANSRSPVNSNATVKSTKNPQRTQPAYGGCELDGSGVDRRDFAMVANTNGFSKKVDDKVNASRPVPIVAPQLKKVRFSKPTIRIIDIEPRPPAMTQLNGTDGASKPCATTRCRSSLNTVELRKSCKPVRQRVSPLSRWRPVGFDISKVHHHVEAMNRARVPLRQKTFRNEAVKAGPQTHFDEAAKILSAKFLALTQAKSQRRRARHTKLHAKTIVPDCHFVMVSELGGSLAMKSAMKRQHRSIFKSNGSPEQNSAEGYLDSSGICKSATRQKGDCRYKRSQPTSRLETIREEKERVRRRVWSEPLTSIAITDLPPTLRDFVELPNDDDWAYSVRQELRRVCTRDGTPEEAVEVQQAFSLQQVLHMFHRLENEDKPVSAEAVVDHDDDEEDEERQQQQHATPQSNDDEEPHAEQEQPPSANPVVASDPGGMEDGNSSGSEESSDSHYSGTPPSPSSQTSTGESSGSDSDEAASGSDVPGLVVDHGSMDDESQGPLTPVPSATGANPRVVDY